MFNSVALDVVIGIVFIYLLYSLLVTIIGEIIATWLGLRARILRKSIERMLVDDITDQSDQFKSRWKWLSTKLRDFVFKPGILYKGSLAEHFYKFPSIKYLGQSSYFKLPSYISAANFSASLIAILKKDGTASTKMEEILNGLSLPQFVNSPETKKLLEEMIKKSEGSIEKFQKLLEAWFDETMERTNGWYKRNLQVILLLIGLVLSITFNVNTFDIIKILSSNTPARNAVVKMATDPNSLKEYENILKYSHAKDSVPKDSIAIVKEFYKKAFTSVNEDAQKASMVMGSGWEFDSLITKNVCVEENAITNKFLEILTLTKASETKRQDTIYSGKAFAYIKDTYTGKLDVLNGIRIKVENNKPYLVLHGQRKAQWYDHLWFVLTNTFSSGRNFFGFLITALALSLGAPFWFDLLNKLIALRSSGKTPEITSKPEEGDVKGRSSDGNTVNTTPQGHDLAAHVYKDPVLYSIAMNEAWLKAIPGVISVNKDYILENGKKTACVEVNYGENCNEKSIPDELETRIDNQNYKVPVVKRNLGHAKPSNGSCDITPFRISNQYDSANWGTLTGIVKDSNTAKPYLLSCSHVLKGDNVNNRITKTTNIVDAGNAVVGNLKYYFLSNFFDIGWAEITDKELLDSSYKITTPRSVTKADADALLPIQMVGGKSGVQNGVLWNNDFSDTIVYNQGPVQMFNLLKLTNRESGQFRALSDGGDSGALIKDMTGKPIGIVIAGNGQFTYAISFTSIFDQFKTIKPFN